MYNIPHFKANSDAEVLTFMKAHPFIMLCGVNANGEPIATHIPVLIEERDNKIFLLAHVMRKQAHTVAYEQNNTVLAVFHGAHSYVSASLYEPSNIASTWNYSAVHAKGKLRFLDDNSLLTILTKLTANFEQNGQSPALVEKMDKAYLDSMFKAIVAFEVELTDIQHVFKLSQNKNEATRKKIIDHLAKGTVEDKQVANAMQEHFTQ